MKCSRFLRRYYFFCIESSTVDFWSVQFSQLLDVCNQNSSFPDSRRNQCISEEWSWQDFLAKSWWSLDWTFCREISNHCYSKELFPSLHDKFSVTPQLLCNWMRDSLDKSVLFVVNSSNILRLSIWAWPSPLVCMMQLSLLWFKMTVNSKHSRRSSNFFVPKSSCLSPFQTQITFSEPCLHLEELSGLLFQDNHGDVALPERLSWFLSCKKAWTVEVPLLLILFFDWWCGSGELPPFRLTTVISFFADQFAWDYPSSSGDLLEVSPRSSNNHSFCGV